MRNRILIIDDDEDFVEATAMLLQAKGYDVICAYNGQDGFMKVKEESPDLIFLDMMMTYKTEGADVAKAISDDAAVKDIPIVMITGARKEMNFPFELKAHPEKLPVRRIIEKPVKPEVLLNIVKIYIARSGEHHRKVLEGLGEVVAKWKDKKGNLIMILHEIQGQYGYVPRDVAFELCRMLDVPLARIYEVITFYNYFKLESPGRHTISVCMGTACYLKGTPQLLQEVQHILNIEPGQTSQDGLFHLQIVRCLGCCGLAPVIMIDDKVYGKVKKEEIVEILSKYTNKE